MQFILWLPLSEAVSYTHLDVYKRQSKGIVAWGKDNAVASGLADRPIRWLVDDCATFVAREKRRGNTYDGIIMDPPSYGRGPGGEIWKLEDCIYDLSLIHIWISSLPSGSRPAAGSSSTRMRGFMAMTPATATRRF